MERSQAGFGRALLAAGLVVVAHVWAASAHGEGAPAPKTDDFAHLLGADPLEIAALAARQGDEAVLVRLRPGVDPAVALVAIHASPFLRSPELALDPLSALAAGRDPELSEAAMRRAREIAQALTLDGLAPREIMPASLRSARTRLTALAKCAWTRPDVKMLAAEAALLLGTLGVPLDPSAAR